MKILKNLILFFNNFTSFFIFHNNNYNNNFINELNYKI